jgi:hypothetical protein
VTRQKLWPNSPKDKEIRQMWYENKNATSDSKIAKRGIESNGTFGDEKWEEKMKERDLYSNSDEIVRMQEVVGLNISRDTGYLHSYFLCIPHVLQEDVTIVLQLCHDSFYPNSSFTSHPTIRRHMFSDNDRIVKFPTITTANLEKTSLQNQQATVSTNICPFLHEVY